MVGRGSEHGKVALRVWYEGNFTLPTLMMHDQTQIKISKRLKPRIIISVNASELFATFITKAFSFKLLRNHQNSAASCTTYDKHVTTEDTHAWPTNAAMVLR